MSVKRISFNPSYIKKNGLWVLNFEDIPLPSDFSVKEKSIVYIPTDEIGGNHKHPREEIFIGLGELELSWLDKNGKKHKELMNKNGKLSFYRISPDTPHTVKNISTKTIGILLEFASGPQKNVEPVKLI